ncbi:MAG: DUF1570 domain-containing protein [Planctomycetota bacterium]
MYRSLESADAREPDATTTYVRAADGRAIVAKVIAEIGSDRLVKLPTGEFDIVPRSQTRPCDKPFVSATRAEVAAKLRADGFDRFTIVPSGYFLFAYDCSEAYYLHTRSILESMLAGVVQQLREWGLEPQRPETPMVVLIVGSRAKFDAIEKMPPEVAAYYSQISNHVVLYEDQRLWEAAPEYAFKQAAYTIAHEGIHQLLANTGIQQRLARWPQWISEGLPEYFCPMKVNTRLITTGDAELPERTLAWRRAGEVNDLRMHQLFRYRPDGGALIRTVVGAGSLTSDGYAVSWGLVHYLAKRQPQALGEYLGDVSRRRPLEKLDYRGADPLFVKHFGEDYAALEKKIQRHLLDKSLQKSYRDPIEYQTHYVMKQIIKRGRTFTTTVALTLSPAEARAWRDKREQLAEAEGKSSAFYTIVCKTRKEANYQLGKLGFRLAQ